jgi:hypothetical protein
VKANGMHGMFSAGWETRRRSDFSIVPQRFRTHRPANVPHDLVDVMLIALRRCGADALRTWRLRSFKEPSLIGSSLPPSRRPP